MRSYRYFTMLIIIVMALFCCSKAIVDVTTPLVGSLNCTSVSFSTASTAGIVLNGTATLPYTGGNSLSYSAGGSILSTGVTGLTAVLTAGSLSTSGNLTYSLSGTPVTSGTASFAVSFGGQACNFSLQVGSATVTTPLVSAINCSNASFSSSAINGVAFTGMATVPYTGGNAATYSAGTPIPSTGVSGLTATLSAGSLLNGIGNLILTISGTPGSIGTAAFPINFGGQNCSLSLPVSTPSTVANGCSSSSTAIVLNAALAFKNALSSSQQSTLLLDYTSSNCYTWSNLPAGLSPRKGIRLGDLSSTQVDLAYAIVKAATGTIANEGYDEVKQIVLADDNLATIQAKDYGSGNYYVAFYGIPSATGTWQFQFTGHHITHNITYKNGVVIGVTPMFEAVEPHSNTVAGVTYSPLEQERKALADMLTGLTAAQLSSAKQSSSFGDVVLGPGQEKKYPTTKLGIQVNTLSDAQKALVVAVIKEYVQDVDAETAACLMSIYQSELNDTYIAYSGTSTVTAQGDYIRIDGPSVWIEFTYQGGVLYKNTPHIHSIYRDRKRDYGASFF